MIPRSFGDLVACAAGLGSYLMLGLVALVVACTETKSPTGPESNFNFAPKGGARLAVGARVVYLGAARSKPINFIRLRVYEDGTTNVIGTLDKDLDPAINNFDFNFVVALGGRKLNTKITMELANRDAATGKETVNYSGRVAQTPLAPGDIRQLEIDLYPGPLSNFDVTAMHIVEPIATQIEGDQVLATAVVEGAAADTRIEWSSLDDNVASIDENGLITTKLPGTARIVAAVGLLADTANVIVKQRLTAVTITPTTITLPRGDSTTFVGKGVDARGAEIVGEQVTWSVGSNGNLALRPTAGRAVAQRIGTGTVTATSVSKPTLSATATVTVGPPSVPVKTIEVTPTTQTATAIGQTKAYTAVGKDAAGNVIKDVVFQWSSSATTIGTVNSSGVATAVAAGNATITAAVEEASGTAAFLVRPPGMQLVVSSGNNQTGTVKTAAAAPVVAKVTDASGNPVAGIDVTFATADVAGVVGTATATSNAQGLVSTTWTFGTKAGTQTVTATNAALANSPLAFTATVAAGAPSKIVFITEPSTTATNRTPFGTQPVIEVQDEFGNPVKIAGNTVTATIASGGGTLTNVTATTDATGRATFTTLTLGGTVGLRSLAFTMTGLPAITAPVTLSAGAATTITVVSGNGGTGKVGTVYAPSPVVLVTDIDGNPVPNATLTLTPGTGGGTVQPGTVTTGPDGKATITGWTLRPTPGTDEISISTPGGTPVKITVTADPNPATQIAINGGSTSGQIGTALAVPPSVIVRDVNNIPVAGVTVTFAVATGGGTITGATQVTNAQGIATVGSWTLGALVGANTMTATSGTLGGSPLTIAATGLTNAATQMALNGGSTTGVAGSALATPPSVIIKDANGNPVAGVPVTFSIGTGGGSITGVNQVSGANGVATLGSWMLGTVAGTNTVIATSAGLTNSPLTITATGTAGAATQMSLNGGSTTGSVNTAVTVPPSVLVRDANNNPVSGVTVTFAVATGGGSITGATAVTNAQGIATVGSWTLGAVAGVNTLTATSNGLTNSPLTISASSVQSGATQMALNGGSTTGTAGQNVATPPSVIVKDANNNPVAGVIVTFAVGTGGGSVTGATQTTNAQGIATVGSWKLGANAGTNTVIATSSGLTNSPLTITATASTAPATQIASYAGSVTGTVGAVVATNPAVIVKDAAGNPVAGVDVTFAVTGGGGTMTGLTQKTNAQGIATVGGWTLGTIVGTNTATATSGTLTGSPVTFTVAASASTAASITAAGGSTTAIAGAAVATPPSVVVKDQYGNVVQGTSVTFAVGTGAGSITGATQTTNANGIATVGSWTMGTLVATNTLTASSTGLTGSPVTFTIASVAGPATQLSLNGGSTSGAVSTALAVPPSVIARDANNNPVSGVTVTFAVATGGGTATALTQTTNAQGIATVGSWTLGALVGANTMTATSGTLGGSPLTIAATGLTNAATQMALNGGSTNGIAGQAVAVAPSVIIKDANGNPVAGVPVTFSIGTGGGSITGVNQVSGANGVATLGSWTLGAVAGTNTVIATSAGLTNSPLTITATGTAGAATQMALNGGSTTGSVNRAVDVPPSVLVRDINNNPVAGVTVTFAVATGGGSITGATAVTNAQGIATVGSWTLGAVAGVNTLTATSVGLTNSPLTISASSVVTGATQMALNGGSTTGTAGQAVATPPSVIVKDANNNPVANVLVTFAVATGGGSVTGATQTTNAQGIATVGSWTLGANAGANTIVATSTGLTNSPLTITATASTAPATQIASYAGSVTGTVGAVVATNPAVIVKDAAGNPVAGVTVTFAVTGGGGSMTGTTQITNAQGIATVGGWTLGTIVGTNTATATSGTLTGSPVTFTVAASASTASKLEVNSGNNQSVASNTAVTPPSVVVKDQYGNVVQGTAVTFAVGTGGGTVTGGAQTTDANGIATVGSWTLGAAAGANTLTASSTGLTGSPLTITATATASVASLANSTITAAPTSITADGVTTSTLTVQLKDATGNNLVASGGTVTITKTTGPAVTLSAVTDNNNGTYTATVKGTVAGAATFSASVGGNALTNASNPATVTLTPGAATKLAFTAQPTNAGPATALGTQPQVTIQDANGNTVTGSTAPITIALTTPAGATLTCTANPVNATAGVATFAGCQVNLANTYTLTATSAGLTSATSSAFTIAAGVATKLVVTTQPGNAASGAALSAQPVITVQDAQGNTVTGSTAAVTLALTTPGGATLTCTANPTNAVAGVTTFAGCAVDKTGVYTITATSAGLTSATTNNFTISAGAATKLVFTTQPSASTASGAAFAQQPVVTIQDAAGNTVTTATNNVTLALTTGTGTLSGTATVAAVAGVATFAGLNIDLVGANKVLTATSGALTAATTSPAFAITAGAATKLAVTTQPSASTASGAAFAQQPVVTIQDAAGNTVTTATNNVTLALTTGTGTLSGTATVAAVAGVATFAGLNIDLVGANKVLTATSGALTAATTSPAFAITAGAATKVVVTTQPSASTAAATAFAQQPVVTIQDAAGNTVTSSTAAVTLALTTGTGTLSGTATVNAVAGVATFAGLSINLTGTDKVLTATSAGLTSGTTTPAFTITAGTATKLAVTTQPSASTAAGAAFAQQPVVTIQDAQGNTVTGSTAAVTLALTTGTGTLSGTATVNAVAGVATFTGLSINLVGNDKVLTATSAGLTSATTSPAFAITVGTAAKLAVTTQPSASTVSSTAFAQQPVVTIQDAQGNTVTTATDNVTLALTTGTGTLAGTATVAAVNGVATFTGLSINLVGANKVLTATSGTLTSATTSPAFAITEGAAAKVVVTTQPSDGTSNTALGTQPVVTVQDAAGNTVTGSTAAVTLTLTTPGGATLSCTTNPLNATSGVATFAGCKVDKSGTYTLTAASTGLTSGTSNNFTISAGTATKLAVTTQPSASTVSSTAFAQQPVVTIQDAQGNTVTGSTAAVTLALTTGTGTLAGTATVNAVAGVATFTGLNINLAGTDKVLTATSAGLTSATTSPAFTITAGAAAKVGFTTQPSDGTSNTALTTQPVAVVQDAAGNTVTSSTAAITFTLTTPAGATLTCTTNPLNATAGVATFAGCKVDKSGNYTLTAASTGLTSGTSSSFAITAGALDHFAVTRTDGTALTTQVAGTAFPVKIVAQDAANNTVTTYTSTVDITSSSLFGSGNGATAAFSAGVLSSHSVTLTRAGTGVTLTATGSTKTGTATFDVVAGSHVKMQVLVPGETAAPGTGTGKTGTPSNATAGTALTSVIVNAVDDNWNVVSSVSDQVSLATSDGNATIPSAAFLSSGTRTFSSSLTLKTAGNQTITASDLTDPAKTANTSPNILVVAGAASKYIVTANPAAGSANDRITVSAQLADANNNAVSTAGVTVNWTSNVGAFGTNGLQVASSVTNSSGIATVVDTLHAGANTTTATDGSARTGSVTVTAAGAANSISATFTNGGRVIVGGSTMTVSAQIIDASSNPVALAGVPIKFEKNQLDATSGSINANNLNDANDPTASITINTDATGKASVIYTSGSATTTLGFTITTTTAPMTGTNYSPGAGAVINRPNLYDVSIASGTGTTGATANSVSSNVTVVNGAAISAQALTKGSSQNFNLVAKLRDAVGGNQVSLSSRTVTWSCSTSDGGSCNETFTGGATSTLAAGQTATKAVALAMNTAADTAGRRYIFTATDGSGAVAGLSSAPTGASGSPFVGSGTLEAGVVKLATSAVVNQTGSNPAVTSLSFATGSNPFTTLANDAMFAVLTFRGRTNSNDPRVGPGDGSSGFITSVPTGWTLVRKDVTADPNDLVTYVYKKIRGASAEANPIAWGFSGQGYGAGVLFTFRGADTTSAGANLIDVSNGQANASGTSFSTPSITTTHAKEKVFAVITVDADGTGQRFTVPSGWTQIAKSDQTANSPMPTFIVIQRNVQTTGAVSATVTGTTAGVSIGTIIAVKQNTIP